MEQSKNAAAMDVEKEAVVVTTPVSNDTQIVSAQVVAAEAIVHRTDQLQAIPITAIATTSSPDPSVIVPATCGTLRSLDGMDVQCRNHRGRIKFSGSANTLRIVCHESGQEFTPSSFEVHSGDKSKAPYNTIKVVSTGLPLKMYKASTPKNTTSNKRPKIAESVGPMEPFEVGSPAASSASLVRSDNNESGYKHVYKRKCGWEADIRRGRTHHYLGVFPSAEKAAEVVAEFNDRRKSMEVVADFSGKFPAGQIVIHPMAWPPEESIAAAPCSDSPTQPSEQQIAEAPAGTLLVCVYGERAKERNGTSHASLLGCVLVKPDLTIGGLRELIVTELNQPPGFVLRKGLVPVHATQDRYPAQEFWRSETEFIVISYDNGSVVSVESSVVHPIVVTSATAIPSSAVVTPGDSSVVGAVVPPVSHAG